MIHDDPLRVQHIGSAFFPQWADHAQTTLHQERYLTLFSPPQEAWPLQAILGLTYFIISKISKSF